MTWQQILTLHISRQYFIFVYRDKWQIGSGSSYTNWTDPATIALVIFFKRSLMGLVFSKSYIVIFEKSVPWFYQQKNLCRALWCPPQTCATPSWQLKSLKKFPTYVWGSEAPPPWWSPPQTFRTLPPQRKSQKTMLDAQSGRLVACTPPPPPRIWEGG